AFAREHYAEPQRGGADPVAARRLRGALPVDADPGEEVVAGRGGFVELGVAAAAVVADGRGADETGGALFVGQRGERPLAGLGRIDPAPAIPLAPVLREPAAEYRLAGEVHDRTDPAQRRRSERMAVPGDDLDRLRMPHARRIARRDAHLAARGVQRGDHAVA